MLNKEQSTLESGKPNVKKGLELKEPIYYLTSNNAMSNVAGIKDKALEGKVIEQVSNTPYDGLVIEAKCDGKKIYVRHDNIKQNK